MGVSLADNDDDDDFGETHEINVTPFIDVILVLLIIFMVAAPLSRPSTCRSICRRRARRRRRSRTSRPISASSPI
ncbi:biopolymer transport protein ExbD [Bradyrhizobium sp. F1.13.4]